MVDERSFCGDADVAISYSDSTPFASLRTGLSPKVPKDGAPLCPGRDGETEARASRRHQVPVVLVGAQRGEMNVVQHEVRPSPSPRV